MTTQAQKQELIGGFIASVFVKKGAETIIGKALDRVAKSPSTKMEQGDVAPATAVVEKALKDDLQARAEHRFDAEEHWRSRNVWGSIVAAVGAIDTIQKLWTNGSLDSPQDYVGPICVIIGVITPLYSRFFASKPLFK